MSELTAKELNNVIVKMRQVVGAAVVFASRKLIAQMKRYQNARNQKKKKRIQRYEKEMVAIKNETPVEEVALYKVATESSLTAAVDEIRKSYPNWHQEIPFFLQRFGQHSKDRKRKNLEEKEDIKVDSADEFIGLNTFTDKCNTEREKKKSLVKLKVEKATKKEKKQFMPKSLKRKDVSLTGKIQRGESVVKRINLEDAGTLAQSSSEENNLEDKVNSDAKNLYNIDRTSSRSFKRKKMESENIDMRMSHNSIDTTSLHPSWVAKQIKLKQEAELMKAPPQNKKMKFDD